MGGQEIKYTATTANYILKSGDGTPKASFFFVAYTRDVDSFIQAALSGAH
jgi:hypothetical protein